MGIYAAMAAAGVHRAGLVDEMASFAARGDGVGGAVCTPSSRHRRGVGQTRCGHPVGVGRALILGAGAATSLPPWGHRSVRLDEFWRARAFWCWSAVKPCRLSTIEREHPAPWLDA